MIVGGAVTFSLVGRQRLAPVLAVAAVVWGASLALVGTVAPVVLAAPLIAVGGIGYAACDVVGRTILQRVTADRMLARVLGALEGIGIVGLAVGSITVPFIVAVVGIEPALVVVGLLLPLGVAPQLVRPACDRPHGAGPHARPRPAPVGCAVRAAPAATARDRRSPLALADRRARPGHHPRGRSG